MSVIIVGAGLAGLATAYRLQQSGINVQLLEAASVAGGRIQPAGEFGHQDLGPTWVWPYAQPVVTQWLDELDLTLFKQFDAGSGLIDSTPDAKAHPQNLPSQYGIARIEGGTHALIKALLNSLDGPVLLDHQVMRCERVNNQWVVNGTHSNAEKNTAFHYACENLIVSTPPRLAANILRSSDKSLNDALGLLSATETWMAQHAKVVIFYETAFWREQGLSGRVASRIGPLVEMHDHSGPNGTPAALFGFSGVPADARHAANAHFIEAIQQQLKRCFGQSAPEPVSIVVKDWAFEPLTATAADRCGDGAHPQVLSNLVRDVHCGGNLWFGASETSTRSPGLIEGALARADQIASELLNAG